MSNTIRFTEEESHAAFDEWRFNCGPGALCGVLDMTPDEIRPHLYDFEQKGYTNPTLMFEILRGLNVRHKLIHRGDELVNTPPFPNLGLVRIQWGGPWTEPGVPMAARYRQTHWAGCRRSDGEVEMFDVNAMCIGGWMPFDRWARKLLPWLAATITRANGSWWPTHIIEVFR